MVFVHLLNWRVDRIGVFSSSLLLGIRALNRNSIVEAEASFMLPCVANGDRPKVPSLYKTTVRRNDKSCLSCVPACSGSNFMSNIPRVLNMMLVIHDL